MKLRERGGGQSASHARELWRRIIDWMVGGEVHDMLTPDEEMRWLRSMAYRPRNF